MKLDKSFAAVYPKQITYSYNRFLGKTTCRCSFTIFINECFDSEDKKYIHNIITDYVAKHPSIAVMYEDNYDLFIVEGTSQCSEWEKKFDEDFGKRLARSRAKKAMNRLFFHISHIIEMRGNNLASTTSSAYFLEQMNGEDAYQKDIINKQYPSVNSINWGLPQMMTLYYTTWGQGHCIQGKKENMYYNADLKHPFYVTYQFPNFNLTIDGDSVEDVNEKVRRYFDVEDVPVQ